MNGAKAEQKPLVLPSNRRDDEFVNTSQTLRDIIEFLPDATFVINRRKEVIAWNRALEEMTGVHKSEVIGRGDFCYSVAFYGERRPILIDLIDEENEDVKREYDFVRWHNNVLRAETFVPTLYGGRGAQIWITASALLDEHGNRAGAIESVRDVTNRRRAEDTLKMRTTELELQARRLAEANTALKVLLEHKDRDKRELEENVLLNAKTLIQPHLDQLRRNLSNARQHELLDLVVSNLEALISPLVRNVSTGPILLTPTEIRIANLIREGKTTKEIADLLTTSEMTVKFHRKNIRRKLGLTDTSANLRSYLLSLS